MFYHFFLISSLLITFTTLYTIFLRGRVVYLFVLSFFFFFPVVNINLFYDNLSMCVMQALSSPVLSAVGERYYKVTAEALRVCGELVRVLRSNLEVGLFC